MQKVDLPTSFTKLNENCGIPDIFTDYQKFCLRSTPVNIYYSCRKWTGAADNYEYTVCDYVALNAALHKNEKKKKLQFANIDDRVENVISCER